MSQLYHYCKGHTKKGAWKVVRQEDYEQRIDQNEDVGFATVLALTEGPTSGHAVTEEVKYQGPFYIDVDSDSITTAIKAAQSILSRLLKNKVPENAFRVYATGKRGFHFLMPMEIFTDEAPVSRLPIVYKMMMLSLAPPKATDLTVYSEGKGRMWRIENRERIDNHRFKVEITPDELKEMSAAMYQTLTEKPRKLDRKIVAKRVSVMEALYKVAKNRAAKAVKPPPIFVDPELRKALQNGLPPCVTMMHKGIDVDRDKGFNALSLQFAKGVAAFSPQDSRDLLNEFSETNQGDSYDTVKKRHDHVSTAFKIASKSVQYDWSCRSALSVLKSEPCMDCPIANIRTEQEDAGRQAQEEAEEGGYEDDGLPAAAQALVERSISDVVAKKEEEEDKAAEDHSLPELLDTVEEGLLTLDEGYGFLNAKGEIRRVSNFTFKITKYYMEMIPNLNEERRVAVMADVFIFGKRVANVVMEESNWTKSGLVSAMSGVSNCAFYGTDDDVQKMKSELMQNIERNAESVRRVQASGIHRLKIDEGKFIFTYVEPSWSIDSTGNENKYFLAGKPEAAPQLKSIHMPKKGDQELREALAALVGSNRPENVAQILPWFMACFLKQHLFAFRNEFPLLGLHGNRGSGKSQTTALMSCLHGIDYFVEHSPLSLPSSTPFALWKTIASSNTAPRAMEEYNKSKLPRKYDEYGEYFKEVWSQGAVKRGTITKTNHGGGEGARLAEYPLSGPVVICSEQGISMPALVQRTVQVSLAPQDLAWGKVRENFYRAKELSHKFKQFSKFLYMRTLELDVDTVKQWLAEEMKNVPISMGDRPQYSYSVLLVGLKFFATACEELELDLSTEIGILRAELIEFTSESNSELTRSKNRSEVDIVMSVMAAMAAMADGENSRLVSGTHYLLQDNFLYLDGITCHMKYLSHARSHDMAIIIDQYPTFKALIKNEPYTLSVTEPHATFGRGRPTIKIDMSILMLKGIESGCFQTGSDF